MRLSGFRRLSGNALSSPPCSSQVVGVTGSLRASSRAAPCESHRGQEALWKAEGSSCLTASARRSHLASSRGAVNPTTSGRCSRQTRCENVSLRAMVSPKICAAWIADRASRLQAGQGSTTSNASEAGKESPVGEAGVGSQLLLDFEKTVVLGDALAAAGRSRLDLTGTGRDRQVRDEVVACFPRAVRDLRPVAIGDADTDSLDGFGQRADLVRLDKHRVGHAKLSPAGDQSRIRDEVVVAEGLRSVAEPFRDLDPYCLVVFRETVFDGGDRIVVGPP